jgi:hypothetical protein
VLLPFLTKTDALTFQNPRLRCIQILVLCQSSGLVTRSPLRPDHKRLISLRLKFEPYAWKRRCKTFTYYGDLDYREDRSQVQYVVWMMSIQIISTISLGGIR